jgi:hypothetical protein
VIAGKTFRKAKKPAKKKICGILINVDNRINICLDLPINNNIRHLNCSTVITSRESDNRLGFFLTWAFFFWEAASGEDIQKRKLPNPKKKICGQDFI